MDDLNLIPLLAEAVADMGYSEPTPIQTQAIPHLLEGHDLLGCAQTGTGKTAAFALPMIQRLALPAEGDGERKGAPREAGRKKAAAPGRAAGLVLVPTRELAMQVCEAIHKYARGTGLSAVPLYGGASMQQQLRALDRGADIVVATPGRALDHIRRGTLILDAVRVLVLDEADEMLDMGFAEDLDAILKETPDTRQTVLFSATLPSRILKIAERHLKAPRRITVAREKAAGTVPRVRQIAYVVRHGEKAAALDRILDMESPASAIVFCRTRLEVDTLVETLNAHGYRAEALHGGMQQRQRDAVMQRVRSATTDLLIATDVAARGLDIRHVSHVVNYDLPADAASYVHRIGRTGRAGREGTAITLAEPREHRLLRSFEQVTKQKIEVATVPTVADLRARRLEATSAALRERLAAKDFDDVRVVVESLADEFDVVDIAAAAVKMAHLATVGEGDDKEISAPPRHDAARAPRGGRATADVEAGAVRLFIGAGNKGGIRPADLVGAITGEAGVPASAVGAIRIAENFSVVDVPEDLADGIVAAMRGAKLRGQKAVVRRDRDVPPGRRESR